MSEFWVGQQVVCVDTDPHNEWPCNYNQAIHNIGLKGLTRGRKYTIAAFAACRDGSLGIRVSEIARIIPYHHARFRPLESKAISIFRNIAANPHIKINEDA